ncbi:hypothetical protein [Microbacterium sp. MPKO10]|uniref:hypothetical protein n=1 Tax=Microbacterium sp. MPKO10 TaxID=2989818 RepID=UPI0022360A53|nr:hypothetical protein [Microbacterium sp. MPKO10]MCW4456621.1 hypothetical protein [Microbacterium sp. MPKO10]
MTDQGGGRTTARRWFIVATIVIAVLVVASGALVSSLVSANSGTEAPVAQSSTPEPDRPLPQNQPQPAPAGPNPTSCDEIYSAEMYDYLTGTGMPLNDPSVADNVGSKDEELAAVIAGTNHLNCSWGYAGDYGLTTSITRIDAGTQDSVRARMDAQGYDCHDELGGTRCIISFADGGGHVGESHFFREGLWVATSWVNFAPNGYTPDIVETIWPGSEDAA